MRLCTAFLIVESLSFGTAVRLSRYSQHMRDWGSPGANGVVPHEAPRGIFAIGVFLLFGSTMASLAGVTLSWPGTFLDRMWVLNPVAHKQLSTFGTPAGILFLLLGTTLAFAGVGWFKRRLWGWGLAVAVIATQVLGDLVNFLRGDFLRGGFGFSIAAALLFYLLRPAVKASFHRAISP